MFHPVHYAIYKMMSKEDNWILKQACRTVADRSGDLDAMMGLSGDQPRGAKHKLRAAA